MIGRGSDNQIIVDAKDVSRNHAVLWHENGAWFIQDLGTPNGTTVNEHRLGGGESVRLQPRSRILLASSCELLFETADEKASVRQAPLPPSDETTELVRGGGPDGASAGSRATPPASENARQKASSAAPAETPKKSAEKKTVEKASAAKAGAGSGGKKKGKPGLVLVAVLLVLLLATSAAYYMTDGFKSASVRSLQQDISELGEITLSSGEQLRSARAAYNALSETDQGRVENAERLTEAEAQYRTLQYKQTAEQFDEKVKALGTITLDSEATLQSLRKELSTMKSAAKAFVTTEKDLEQREAELQRLKDQDAARDLDELIASLGEITLESETAIRQARARYDQANKEVKALVKKLPQLERAEAALYELKVEAAYARLDELQRDKAWEALKEETQVFLKSYGDSDRASDAENAYVESCLQISKQYENAKQYEAAEKVLDEGLRYERTANDERLKSAQEKLEAVIEKLRPQNAAVLGGNCKGGYCRIVVQSGSEDALIKLENIDNASQYLLFYVRAGETATLNVRDGSYTLKYATGFTWYGLEEYFGERTKYSEAQTVVVFKTTYEGNYVHYTEQQITLYAVAFGNLSTSVISADDF